MRKTAMYLAFVMVAGCSDAATSVQGPGQGQADAHAADGLVSGADALADSATATVDAGADGAGQDAAATATDAEAGDAQADVAEPKDADAVAQDDAGPDSGPVDSGGVDAGPTDSGSGVCAQELTTFEQVKAKALVCATPFQCWHPGPKQEQCPCKQFYSDATLDWKALTDLEVEAKSAGCAGSCSPEPCAPANTQVGVCQSGLCETVTPSCKQLDQLASAAIGQGIKCTQDSECTFKVSSTLGCGCPAYVNVATMGPGKSLFQYMVMLVLAYKTLGCTADVECACPNPNAAHCVAGVCKGDL